MSESRPLRDRIAATYREALTASQHSAGVSIHVGQEVWDELREMAKVDDRTLWPSTDPKTMFGFPILLEPQWERLDRIEVHTRKEIW